MTPRIKTLPPEMQELLTKFPAHWTPEQRRSGEEIIREWYAQSLRDLEGRLDCFLKLERKLYNLSKKKER